MFNQYCFKNVILFASLIVFFVLPLEIIGQVCWSGNDELNPDEPIFAPCDDIRFEFESYTINNLPADITFTVEYYTEGFDVLSMPGTIYDEEEFDGGLQTRVKSKIEDLNQVQNFSIVLDVIDYFNDIDFTTKLHVGGQGCSQQVFEYNNVLGKLKHVEVADGENDPALLSELYDPGPNPIRSPQYPFWPPDLAQGNSQQVAVKGTVIIDEDYTIYGDASGSSYLHMYPEAEIIVDNNVILTVEKSTILGECQTWKRIKLKEGAKIVLIDNLIEDGIRAIELSDNTEIVARGNTFNNNYTSIYVPPSGDGTKQSVSFSGVYSNEFGFDGSTTPPYEGGHEIHGRPMSGMELHDVRFIDLNGVIGSNNEFYRLANGILAYNSNLEVNNATFNDIQPAQDEYGYPPLDEQSIAIMSYNESMSDNSLRVYGNTSMGSDDKIEKGILVKGARTLIEGVQINDCNTGIQVEDNASQIVLIRDNDIEAKQRGLRLLNSTPMFVNDVKDNTVESINTDSEYAFVGIEIAEPGSGSPHSSISDWYLENNSVTGDGSHYMHTGIEVINASGTHLIGNTVEANNSSYSGLFGLFVQGGRALTLKENDIDAQGNNESYGMRMEGMARSDVLCNDVVGFEEGVNFYGMCPSTEFLDNQIGQALHNGLLLGNPPNDGMAWIGRQILHGNDWSGSYGAGNYEARHVSPFKEIWRHSKFERNTPLPKRTPSDWFVAQTGSMYNCATGEPGGPGKGDIDSFDIYVMRDSTLTDQYPAPANWIADRNLYNRMLEDQDQKVTSFQTQQYFSGLENATIGDLANTMHALDTGRKDVLDEHFATKALQQSLNSLSESIATTDSLIADCGSCPDSADLSETRDSLVEVYYEESGYLADSMSTVASEIKALVQTADSDNASITSSTTPGATEQWIRSVYYDSWFEDTDSIIDLHRDSLLSLSTACPIEQGQSVYIARALLSLDSTYAWDTENDCQTAGSGGQKERQSVQKVRVYPNPASKTITVRSENSLKIRNLSVINTNGHEVLNKTLETEQEVIRIDASPGMYYLIVRMEDGSKSVRKIVVQ